MHSRIRLDADGYIRALTTFLKSAEEDLSPEDHLRVLEEVVDTIDDKLEARAEGRAAAYNLPDEAAP